MSRNSISVLGSATALAVLLGASGSALAGIANTKHNLANSTVASNNRVTSTGGAAMELCAFCHTPHGAASVQGAPLWNKNLNTAATFSPYSSASMQAGVPTSADIRGGVSFVCLSCHDGTQAMDNILNMPGSGGYSATGGGTGGRAFGWANGTGTSVSAAGVLVGNGVSLIGTDLQNDHPIAIPYCGGGLTITGATGYTGTCADADFRTNSGTVQLRVSSSTAYVDLDNDTTREKTDIILYARSNVPYVECGSCHDPHTENQTFLRTVNGNNSTLCLGCHDK